MALIKVQARWNDDERQKQIEMGLTPDDTYELKDIIINTNAISYIDVFDGYCCINFSADTECSEYMVTNVLAKDVSIFGEVSYPKYDKK